MTARQAKKFLKEFRLSAGWQVNDDLMCMEGAEKYELRSENVL